MPRVRVARAHHGLPQNVCLYSHSLLFNNSQVQIYSKLDLLVKVRYQNPLPPPPCPPKLLEIPTDPHRYARPEFLDSLANDAPLPMIVDGEMGMPLDLGQWEALWADGTDDAGEYCNSE